MAKIITKDSKPGKGIEKDAPEKRRFFLFFELFFDKFFKLVQLNFIYFVTLIPLFMGLYYCALYNPIVDMIVLTPTKPGIILLLVSLPITGPATAGFTYVIRNMQRREHTWVMSDFFRHFAKNFKQGLLMGIMDLVCYTLLYVAILFYTFIMPNDAPEAGNMIPILGSAFVIAMATVYTWAHYYIYTMMVTFKLEFGKLFKNALIFAIAKSPLNLLITAFIAVVALVFLWLISVIPIVGGGLVPIILLSLMGFIIVFSTYPTIDKVMLQRVNKRVLNTRG